jgi:stage II sporulation protein D
LTGDEQVAAPRTVKTFGKRRQKQAASSATVAAVSRFALRLGAVCCFGLGLLASSLYVAFPAQSSGSSTTSTGSTTITTTSTVPSTTSPAPSVLVFNGRGWGHGLGLSQWGAYGYALHGWTHDRILAHYYTGTILGTVRGRTVRVLVASGAKLRLGSTVPWTVTDSDGAVTSLDPGTLVLKGAAPSIPAEPTLRAPFTFASKQPLAVNGVHYRGKILVSQDRKLVTAVDLVGLEQYLKGVVPSEMPSAWPPEALQAQAVAARSYALANLTAGKPYDLYGDTRSQVYGGVEAESLKGTAAVQATRAQVVLYNGKVADTLFFSTSGGRTVSALEATGVAVPYLQSVTDPYDTASPYHVWGPVVLGGAAVSKKLKLAAPIADFQTTLGPSGRVKTATVISDDDSQVALTGSQVRAALDLRSTWFETALLSLLPTARTMTFGGALSLTGAVHGAASVLLEAKPAGAFAWTTVGPLAIGADGRFSMLVRPPVSTQYRLAWGAVRAGLARISVAARVTAAASSAGVQGTVAPQSPGAPVVLQQQVGAAWTTVAQAVTDATGSFSFAGPLQPGTYRARCTPGHGLAAGNSANLVVQ